MAREGGEAPSPGSWPPEARPPEPRPPEPRPPEAWPPEAWPPDPRPSARTALRHGIARLRQAGIERAGLDARLLLAQALGTDQAGLLRDLDRAVDAAAYAALIERRAAHEPLALIRGWQEFWSLRFAVSAATLIPRPDSETLVEATRGRPGVRRILDLGTGTGCLLLACLTEHSAAWGLGVDRVAAAAALARDNAAALGLGARAAFLCADWAAPIAGPFDLVVSNPPYIARPALAGLMPEVARFEPASALDGGQDGLCAYRALLAALPRLLAPAGLAVLEAGHDQAAQVAHLAREAGFAARVRPDLAGIGRAVLLENPVGIGAPAH